MNDLMHFDQTAKEYVVESMTYLDPADRKEWRQDAMLALEANNTSLEAVKNRGAMVNQLYKSVITNAKTIDFGAVEKSKGNVMALQGWKTTEKAIDTLSNLLPDSKEVKLLTEMHDTLVQTRADFEFGYKYDVELIKTLYCVMVFNMYELIDTCICVYNAKVNGGHPPKHKYAVKTAQQYLQLVKTGEWNRIMKAFKGDSKTHVAKESVEIYGSRSEPLDDDITVLEAAQLLTDVLTVFAVPIGVVFGLVLAYVL